MSVGINIAVLTILLLVLLFGGVRVAFALGIVGLVGLVLMIPGIESAERMLGDISWVATKSVSLTAVPMFVLMGEFLVYARMNKDLYGEISMWFGNVRGGLCHATIVSCAIFAAMSGSSVATSATLGRIAGPEMLKRGYSTSLTYGTIAAGGTLGILIPPSIAMIVYGNLAGVSVGDCFLAGIIPGIICTISFMVLVSSWGRFIPGSMPIRSVAKMTVREKLVSSIKLVAPLLIIFAVLGGIYLGITTPTEAGAIGAFGAFILIMVKRDLNRSTLKSALFSTVRTTSFIMLIVVGASVVSFVMHYLRVPEVFTKTIIQLGLSRYLVITLFYLLYFVLGMFIDPISMMVMTIPTIMPTVIALGFDPVWFAVPVTMLCEIGLITPPVGVNLYILQGVSDASLNKISIGASPFVAMLVLNLVLITVFPISALWLPSQI